MSSQSKRERRENNSSQSQTYGSQTNTSSVITSQLSIDSLDPAERENLDMREGQRKDMERFESNYDEIIRGYKEDEFARMFGTSQEYDSQRMRDAYAQSQESSVWFTSTQSSTPSSSQESNTWLRDVTPSSSQYQSESDENSSQQKRSF